MKKIKILIIIVLMIAIWFSKDIFWYYNFKNLYDSNINGKILNLRQSRGGREIKIYPNSSDYLNLYSENDEELSIGDSISKNSKSTQIKIFKRNNNKWIYFKSTFISKDLDYYSLIVKKNDI